MAADVFLSYARRDAEPAGLVKARLEDLGLTVFFDTEGLDGGDVFPEVLEREIRAAGATISLWNSYALTREWVRHEVKIAQEARNLIPVEIGPISDDVMTLALSKLHRLNLTGFDGRADHAGWQDVVRALARTLKRPDLVKARAEREKAEARAARLEADLKAERARKGNLRPWQAASGVVIALGTASFAAWYGLNLGERSAGERLRNSIITPEIRAAIAKTDIDTSPDARATVRSLLIEVPLGRLMEASAVGDAEAALLAAWAHEFGEGGVTENENEATRLYRRACEYGSMRGCSNLGTEYRAGETIEKNDVEANRLFVLACDAGVWTGCNNLGLQHAYGEGISENDAEANRLYQVACENGAMDGCNNLGWQFENGQGVAASDQEAFRLYRLACDGGNMSGCANLGVQYANGKGVAEDDAEANRLHRQACDGGNMFGCSNLGIQYANGEGVTEDDAEASRLYRRACEGGNMRACYELGLQYALGEGVGENDEQADRFLRIACDGGESFGCGVLGWRLAFGLGETTDVDVGGALLKQACDGGEQWSCERLAELAARVD